MEMTEEDTAPEERRPPRPAMREVFKTPGVQVRRQQKGDGSTKLIVEIRDSAMGDAILEAIRNAAG